MTITRKGWRSCLRPLPLLLCLTACSPHGAPPVAQSAFVGRSPDRVTSAELIGAGERDTVYIRRVRMFEQLAATINTDSLARIMTGAMTAPTSREPIYVEAMMCQQFRTIWQYGAIASKRALNRMEDSLFSVPGSRDRWVETQKRFPTFGGLDPAKCDVSALPHAADSLNNQPYPTAQPNARDFDSTWRVTECKAEVVVQGPASIAGPLPPCLASVPCVRWRERGAPSSFSTPCSSR